MLFGFGADVVRSEPQPGPWLGTGWEDFQAIVAGDH